MSEATCSWRVTGNKLPHGMGGFVDVLKLPRDGGKWPEPGQTLRFEVLQHTPGQVRLCPLDPEVPP